MSYDYPSSIEDAAKWLDEVKPDWYETISLIELDMEHVNNCILGQVFDEDAPNNQNGYDWAINEYFEDDEIDCHDEIFGADASPKEWRSQVYTRKPQREFTYLEGLQIMDDGEKVKAGNGVILQKSIHTIVDNQGNIVNAFTYWNSKFTFVERVLTFGQLKAGEKFITTNEEVKQKISPKSSYIKEYVNYITLSEYTTGWMGDSTPVKKVED